MATIPKKAVERFVKAVPKFQRVLRIAQDRDVNEADTVAIIQDMLAEVFGFDKYLELTSEYAIRGTFCDLAIKIDGKIQYLIEVKAIGLTLKEHHLRQLIDYAANHGAQWVVLTNSLNWELHKVRFERPINYDLVCSFNFSDLNSRKAEDQEKLFLLSKEGLTKSAREDYYERVQSVNRFVIGAIVLSESIIRSIKKDIKKLAPGLKVEDNEIKKILSTEVLKRDVVEGDEASKANNRIRRLMRKTSKRQEKQKREDAETPIISASEKLPGEEEARFQKESVVSPDNTD